MTNIYNLCGFYYFSAQAEYLHSESDVDVAVIVDKLKGDYFPIRPLLWRIRSEIDDRIEPIILETDHDDSGFLAVIQKTGIVI